jgi:hypothetical protein
LGEGEEGGPGKEREGERGEEDTRRRKEKEGGAGNEFPISVSGTSLSAS